MSKYSNGLINEALVRKLIGEQFSQWRDLPVKKVAYSSWDNCIFHLGSEMLVRLPSAERYAAQVSKEQHWLPLLATVLPLPIPWPVAQGRPNDDYPFAWSIYKWLPGEAASIANITSMRVFALDLAVFLRALHTVDATAGPLPGEHNFFRGGELTVYDDDVRKSLCILGDTINNAVATNLWNKALTTTWQRKPVWVHGDVSPGNLLVECGCLSAVIDFGGLAVGDPACDLAIAWTMFDEKGRAVFRRELGLDDDTWLRGMGWVLWKALIVAAGICETNAAEGRLSLKTIADVLTEFERYEINEGLENNP